jgi:hypothetical protein
VTVTERGISRVDLIPLHIDRMRVNLAQGKTFEAIKKRVRRLSKPFGTEIHEDATHLWIEVAQAVAP